MATVEGGSFGTFNQFGNVSGSEGIFDYSVSVGHIRQSAVQVTPFELLPRGVPLRTAFTDIKTVSTKLGAQLTDEFRLNYVLRFSDSAYLDQADGGFPYVPLPYRNLNDQQQLIMRARPSGRRCRASTTSSGELLEVRPAIRRPARPARAADTHHLPRRADPVRLPRRLAGLTRQPRPVWGTQREDERFETTGIDRSNGNSAGFAELQTTPFAGAALVANIRHDSNDQFGGATTFRVAPSYIVPATDTRLKGSVGTGFKPPTLSQLYQDYPGFRFFGNPNLRPEESFGFDGGFEQPLFDGFMTWARPTIRPTSRT